MKKRCAALLLSLLLLLTALAVPAYAAGPAYTDLPASGWAREAILAAYEHGLMKGQSAATFGVGASITRAEFATVVVRMFGWDAAAGENAFTDISNHWARSEINTAAAHGAVVPGGAFGPGVPITRREMAVMLVRALGLWETAEGAADYPMTFTDVTADRGAIAVAYDIGMTNGMSATSFAPEDTATRAQAAAMLVRVYERYIARTDFTHAFYAISSYSQLELAKTFDAVSLGWSRMTWDAAKGAQLKTTSAGGNEYCVPAGYEDAVKALRSAGVKLHLSVFMETAGGLNDLLASETGREQAVEQIVNELTVSYAKLGDNPYDGVTIDFEGLREAQKENFTAFLSALRSRLAGTGKTLYVAVAPATAGGAYFDGYDYRAIGALADKVILMAYNYAATDMSGFLGTTYYRTAAPTPFQSVYYSLRAACDGKTGVEDRSKLVLGMNCAASAWEIDGEGRLLAARPVSPTTDTVYTRLTGGGERGWSDTYRNAYLTYTTEEGRHYFLWYEDQRGAAAKTELAKLFGVTSVSLWRLGQIPSYPDAGLYYDVPAAIR